MIGLFIINGLGTKIEKNQLLEIIHQGFNVFVATMLMSFHNLESNNYKGTVFQLITELRPGHF
jgi:hypothetical protein